MDYRIIKLTDERHDTRTFKLVPVDGEVFDFIPGQFVMLSANIEKDGEKELIKRAYSILSAPNHDYLELTILKQLHGLMSNYVMTLKEGDIMDIEGPFGHFTFDDNMKFIVMVAGGIGIVPMMSMIRSLVNSPSAKKSDVKFKLFYSARKQDELLFADELKKHSEDNENFKYILTTTRDNCDLDQCYPQRLEMDVFNMLFKHPTWHNYFICGSLRFVQGMKDILTKEGVEKEKIKIEGY